MTAIANFFVRAKHWQIFASLLLLPLSTVFADIPGPIRSWRELSPGVFVVMAIDLFALACFLGWLASMAVLTRTLLLPEVRTRTGFLRFALVYPVLYGLTFLPLVFLSSPWQMLILPVHLLCLFCLLYVVYFAAKNLVLANVEKRGRIYEYARPFCLLWFFPLGVWIIQPKINRLAAEYKSSLEQIEN